MGSGTKKEAMIVFTGSLLDPMYSEIAESGGNYWKKKTKTGKERFVW